MRANFKLYSLLQMCAYCRRSTDPALDTIRCGTLTQSANNAHSLSMAAAWVTIIDSKRKKSATVPARPINQSPPVRRPSRPANATATSNGGTLRRPRVSVGRSGSAVARVTRTTSRQRPRVLTCVRNRAFIQVCHKWRWFWWWTAKDWVSGFKKIFAIYNI